MKIGDSIKIISDGTPEGTKVLDSQENPIDSIINIDWSIQPDRASIVRLELSPVQIDVVGNIAEIIFRNDKPLLDMFCAVLNEEPNDDVVYGMVEQFNKLYGSPVFAIPNPDKDSFVIIINENIRS